MRSYTLTPPLSFRELASDHADLDLPNWDEPVLLEMNLPSVELLAAKESNESENVSDSENDFGNDKDDVLLLEMLSNQGGNGVVGDNAISLLFGNTVAELDYESKGFDIFDVQSVEFECNTNYAWDSSYHQSPNSLTFSSESGETRFSWIEACSHDEESNKTTDDISYDNIQSECTEHEDEIVDDDRKLCHNTVNCYPGIQYEWLVEIIESVEEGLYFKLCAEGGAYMKLHRHEIILSIESLLVESEDPKMKFLIKFVDNTLAVVDGYKVLDIMKSIVQNSPFTDESFKETESKAVQEHADLYGDDLSVLEEQSSKNLLAVVSPWQEETDDFNSSGKMPERNSSETETKLKRKFHTMWRSVTGRAKTRPVIPPHLTDSEGLSIEY
jgi:hypothetical protein